MNSKIACFPVSAIRSFAILSVMLIATVTRADQPNIVFIFADDQCFETIGGLNNAAVETPNLDKLVRRGTTFTHAYNMGSWSGAVCVASRTMLNSGRFVWNANAIYDKSEKERSEGRWWSEYMKAAGYRTYMTGKWHCKANANKAFDVARDIRAGMPGDTEAGYQRPAADGSDPWSPSDPKFGGYWKGGTHWSEVVANHSQDYFSQAASRDEPFFMYLAFNAPHDPRQSPQEYVDKYPVDSIQTPENFLPVYPYAEQIGCGPKLRDERLAPFPRTPHQVNVHRQEYYAIITHMDVMIGRILDAIEKSGKADNTWIFFTADHGLAVGQHGLIGKQNLYDHSVRVPMVVVGPGVDAGKQIETPVYLQDIMPTTLELANVAKPEHVEFHSLLPMLDGEPSPYQRMYGAYLNKQRSIRTETHKLIAYPEAGVLRLYDIAADPREMKDLADNPKSKPLLQEMFAQLQDLQREMNDDLDLTALKPAN
ncbi:Arylsulfatase [Rubripirellula tenax]|uniref:Arylsulfatase n=1 Tax=Rubripirellula tenax TaxID=2528015 RepID=A0A5C6EZX5_9BACT|nr:sulfatase-like hydrolase/transferase [Rubripirellula tenax]TWU54582.1 Arylsulfatase [Rubripirellula tenax]